MSLLQKAIRRGETGWAIRAASTLLKQSPDPLWRRIGIIAFEDVGLGDLNTVMAVHAGLAGKAIRAKFGGEEIVATALAARMAGSVKCRATDDLAVIAEWHPGWEEARRTMPPASAAELVEIALGPEALEERAIALWYLVGTRRCRASFLAPTTGDPDLVLAAFSTAGVPDPLIDLARAVSKHRVIHPALLALLWREAKTEDARVEADDLPPTAMAGPIPGWAYDMFTREGKAALRRMLDTECETARWVRAHAPPAERVDLLGGLLFRVESGLVDRRLRWPAADQLRIEADRYCHGARVRDSSEVLRLLRRDLPLLDEVRRHARW